MTKPDLNDTELSAMFDAAQDVPELRPDFLEQLQADARSALTPARVRATPRRGSWLADMGGWFSLGGLVAATVAGVWIGVSPPEFMPDPLSLIDGSSMTSAFEDDLTLPFDIADPEEI